MLWVQVSVDTSDVEDLVFEQDPVQIVDALLPLYLSGTLLRALQVAPPPRPARPPAPTPCAATATADAVMQE